MSSDNYDKQGIDFCINLVEKYKDFEEYQNDDNKSTSITKKIYVEQQAALIFLFKKINEELDPINENEESINQILNESDIQLKQVNDLFETSYDAYRNIEEKMFTAPLSQLNEEFAAVKKSYSENLQASHEIKEEIDSGYQQIIEKITEFEFTYNTNVKYLNNWHVTKKEANSNDGKNSNKIQINYASLSNKTIIPLWYMEDIVLKWNGDKDNGKPGEHNKLIKLQNILFQRCSEVNEKLKEYNEKYIKLTEKINKRQERVNIYKNDKYCKIVSLWARKSKIILRKDKKGITYCFIFAALAGLACMGIPYYGNSFSESVKNVLNGHAAHSFLDNTWFKVGVGVGAFLLFAIALKIQIKCSTNSDLKESLAIENLSYEDAKQVQAI